MVAKTLQGQVVITPFMESGKLPPIREPFLLSVCIPLTVDAEGNRWINDLWAKDLALHLDYLHDLTLICPCQYAVPAKGDISMQSPPFNRVKVIELPVLKSYWDGFRLLPYYVWQYWKAIEKAAIVQTSFGMWPFSEAWFAVPLGKLRNRFVITNVESSFWRIGGGPSHVGKRFIAGIKEFANRLCVRTANMRLFTSTAYAQEFLPLYAPRAHVIPATWINDEHLLTEEAAVTAWQKKIATTKLIFAGRLVPDKGVVLLLQALPLLAEGNLPLDLTIIGDGPLRSACEQAQQRYQFPMQIRVLDSVPYGEPFFRLIREHDAVLIPSLSVEQPRLIFDAFSQAVPVIGSDTGGIAEIVKSNLTGKLIPPANLHELVGAITWACYNRPALKAMGLRGLETCRKFTHQAMHAHRHRLLVEALN